MRINEITMGYHPSTLAYPYKVKTDKDGKTNGFRILTQIGKNAANAGYPRQAYKVEFCPAVYM